MKQLLPIVIVLAAQAAAAQTVYRCGPEGRSYSDAPCPGGRSVTVADERSAQDRAAAERVAAKDRALARRLREDRLAAQREDLALARSGAGPANVGPAVPTAVPLTPAKKKPASKKKPAPVLQPAAAGTWLAAALATRPRSG